MQQSLVVQVDFGMVRSGTKQAAGFEGKIEVLALNASERG